LIHYARMIPGLTRQRIDEVIRLVGLEQRIHDKVKTYSLGMRQRLGVAQAILHRPALLVLDEPTNGLDPAGIRELRDYLRRLAREEGTSVFVSSHLLSEMELMCDRVAIIQSGKLVDVRSLREMVTDVGEQFPVTFEPDSVSAASAALASRFPGVRLENGDAEITAVLSREQIPEAIAALVQAGVRIYGVRTETRTLEDKYLEMTGGARIE